jgi:hypothetical protein
MTNQNTKKSDGATSRQKDQEAQDSQPDHSATIKDIELNLLRELLKDGVGSGEDSNKALSQILQEINDRNRRYLLSFVAVASLAIGILSFIGYRMVKSSIKSKDPDMVSQTLDMAKAELASLQETRKRIERLENETMAKWAALKKGEFETQGMGVIKDTERKITAEECTLHGTSISGKIVFYPRGEPKAYQPGERVCVLSDTYPWSCEREALLKYVGRKVFLSIAEFEPGLYIDFTVVGFFSPRDQGRMIQITMGALENLIGTENARKYIVAGVLDGEIIFPEGQQGAALEIGRFSRMTEMKGVRSQLHTGAELGL